MESLNFVGLSFKGWPGVVTAIGHWFEKGKKGFIMGVWGSNNAVGNILGSIIAGEVSS